MNGDFGSSRGPASYPAWRQGYTPTAEEWKNVFSNKADAIADNSHQTFDSPTLNNARINDGTITINGTDHPLSDLIARKSGAILFSSAEEAEKTDISADVTYFIALSRTATSDPATAHYRRVPAQPSHPGRIQSLDGSWWEICSDSVRPEMLATSAIGYKVGENGYATATDDTQALQDAMTVGIELGIPVHLHGKWYRHNSKIYARPLSGTPYPNASPEKGVITRWTTINAPQLVIIGFGNAGIIAGADMTDQLEVYAPDTLGNDAQPQWCRFENIKFDGNDHVSGSNLKLSWSGDAHIKNCGFARAGTGISFHGYGVFLIQHCDIGARFFCIDVQRGGDATITDCDFFIQSIGARIAGNIKFARNILTGTAYDDTQNERIGVILNPIGTVEGSSFPYAYGVRIDANEFFAIDTAIYGDASSAGFDAINQISVTNNHALGDVNANTDIIFLNLAAARNIHVAGNQISRDVAAISNAVTIYLNGCDTVHIADNDFSNMSNSSIVVTGCTNISLHHNTFTNVGCISNYMKQSENLTAPVWNSNGLSAGSGPGRTVPSGTMLCKNGATLTYLSETAVSGYHSLSQTQNTTAGQYYTFSAIVSPSSCKSVMLCPFTAGTGAKFDLSDPGVISTDNGVTAGITDLWNGNFRIWCCAAAQTEGTVQPSFILLNESHDALHSWAARSLYAGAFMWTVGQTPSGYSGPNGDGYTGGSAPIVLTDCFQCIVDGCQLLSKYGQSLPLYLVSETGSSNYNGVYRNNIPETVNPFYRIGSSSFFESWERSHFRATKTSVQMVSPSTQAIVSFPNVGANRGDKFHNNTYAPGQGISKITSSVVLSGCTAGSTISLAIFRNGVQLSGISRPAIATSDSLSLSMEDESSPGDYYQAFFYNGGSSQIAIGNDTTLTFFTGTCS